jgi:hypothetical protein
MEMTKAEEQDVDNLLKYTHKASTPPHTHSPLVSPKICSAYRHSATTSSRGETRSWTLPTIRRFFQVRITLQVQLMFMSGLMCDVCCVQELPGAGRWLWSWGSVTARILSSWTPSLNLFRNSQTLLYPENLLLLGHFFPASCTENGERKRCLPALELRL